MPRSRKTPADEDRGLRLGQKLRAARKRAGKSARSLSELSGVGLDTLRAIEGGRSAHPSVFLIGALCFALKRSLDSTIKEVLR